MRGLPSIYRFSCNEFNKFNNTGAQMLDSTLKFLNHIFEVKNVRVLPYA